MRLPPSYQEVRAALAQESVQEWVYSKPMDQDVGYPCDAGACPLHTLLLEKGGGSFQVDSHFLSLYGYSDGDFPVLFVLALDAEFGYDVEIGKSVREKVNASMVRYTLSRLEHYR